MSDRKDIDPADTDADAGEPVSELATFDLEPDPDLPGRVQRSIQRRRMASDSLDFSLAVMMMTFWDYLRALMEAVGERGSHRKD